MDNNKIILKKIIRNDTEIKYYYDIIGSWKAYFNATESFTVKYSGIDITKVPNSILVLPLIGNIIVMAALFKGEIVVETIDSDFYNSLPDILQGYANMYPKLSFCKNIIKAKKIEKNKLEKDIEFNLLFFSGGVDAYSSLINHEKEKLGLITIWGADVPIDNQDAWNQVYLENCKVAEEYGLDLFTVKANLHTFICEEKLNEWSYSQGNDNWWYSFQHSVGMMLLAAPIGYVKKCSKIYFAATYSEKDEKGYAIASDPSIDNKVKFCGNSIVHDGFKFSRQDKIANLCNYTRSNKSIKLRVCFKSETGNNCCKCRKCLLTIFEILLEGAEPELFGFNYDKKNFSRLFAAGIQELAHEHPYDFRSLFFDMQKKFRAKYKFEEVPVELQAFYKLSIDEMVNFMSVPNNLANEKEKENACLKKQIQELKTWINDLEKGKRWLEKHSEDMEVYIQELLKGKAWLEKEYNKLIENQD